MGGAASGGSTPTNSDEKSWGEKEVAGSNGTLYLLMAMVDSTL